MNAFVKLIYGPYESHGVVRHRTQRIRGVASRYRMYKLVNLMFIYLLFTILKILDFNPYYYKEK